MKILLGPIEDIVLMKILLKIFTKNPFREELPYNYSLSRDNIVNSISYILYKDYIINKKTFKIAEHSGWRKINSLNTTENVSFIYVYQKSVKHFIIGSHQIFLSPDYLEAIIILNLR